MFVGRNWLAKLSCQSKLAVTQLSSDSACRHTSQSVRSQKLCSQEYTQHVFYIMHACMCVCAGYTCKKEVPRTVIIQVSNFCGLFTGLARFFFQQGINFSVLQLYWYVFNMPVGLRVHTHTPPFQESINLVGHWGQIYFWQLNVQSTTNISGWLVVRTTDTRCLLKSYIILCAGLNASVALEFFFIIVKWYPLCEWVLYKLYQLHISVACAQ